VAKTSLFTIGRITGVHGLNGNLKVWSFAQSIETFAPGRKVILKAEKEAERSFTILKAQPYKKGILLTIEGVDNRDLADGFVGQDILINRDQLPEPEKDSWYWQDLIGLDVFDDEKKFIGSVKEIFPTGAHDMLVVMNHNRETLVPMHRHFVKSVDMDKKAIVITLPEDY